MKIPKEVKEFIYENYRGVPNDRLSEMIKNNFDYDMSRQRVKFFKARHKLNSGLTGRFEKSHIPINKGTKGMFNVGGNKTSFKKGNIPANRKEIGSIRFDSKDGYIVIKIQDGKRNKNWKPLHQIVYEEYHKEKLKDDDVIRFADSNIYNFSKDNLIKIDRLTNLRINADDMRNDDPDIHKAIVLNEKLKRQTKKVKETKCIKTQKISLLEKKPKDH